MRLILGKNNKPELLVDVSDKYCPLNFNFWVVNGNWEGTYENGNVTVNHPYRDDTIITGVDIICDEQDRLRGDYNTVLANFSNPDYKAPAPAPVIDYDEDIPF